jgi:uncharacterized protein (TIGR03086 family)
MSETADRFRKVSAAFTERVERVPDGAWDNPSPCTGWVARDVVGHLVGWIPGFMERYGVEFGTVPSVDADPAGAWAAARDAVQRALDDPAVASRTSETPMGQTSMEQSVGMFVIGDVLIHTWDLARAAGLDEKLDPDEVGRLSGMMQMSDEAMRSSGEFGPRVPVPDSADAQTKLIAFSGREP